MTIDKSFKIGIITSLIGSIVFLYLLDPILKIFSNLFFVFSNKVSSYFVDNLYREIAIGKSDYSLTQMVIFIAIITSLFSFTLLINIRKSQNPLKKQYIKKRLENSDSPINKSVWRAKFLPILTVIFLNVLMVLQLVSSHIKVSSINTFDQRIRILAPYINEKEKMLLISRFSSMTTYNDYIMIMLETETIAKENKIILPEQIYTYTY